MVPLCVRALAVLVALVSSTAVHAQETPPNIVLVFADDLGYGDLSCYGHPATQTPRLDALARDGLRHQSFYVGASVCTPSRAALLTGKYPPQAGLTRNLGPDSPGGLPLGQPLLPERLAAAGYRTGAFGKWHLGAVPGYLPTDRGFDTYFGLLYSNDMEPPWVATTRELRLHRDAAPTDEYPVDQATLTRRYTDAAIAFLDESVAAGRPFFAYLPYAMPHLPLAASAPFAGASAGGDYGDVVEEIDANVGRLLDHLRAAGLDSTTLVIVTSDNGPWRNLPARMTATEPVERYHGGSTGALAGAKNTSLEGGFRVPAIARWPGNIPAGGLSAEPVTSMDVTATLLQLATGEVPADLDGHDLAGYWFRGEPSPTDTVLYFQGERLEAVRAGRWKLRVAPAADDYGETESSREGEPVLTRLYDLANDPAEHFDFAGSEPEVVEALWGVMVREAAMRGGDTWGRGGE